MIPRKRIYETSATTSIKKLNSLGAVPALGREAEQLGVGHDRGAEMPVRAVLRIVVIEMDDTALLGGPPAAACTQGGRDARTTRDSETL